MTAHTVGGAALGPSRLPANRPSVCQVGGCPNPPAILLAHPKETVVLWVCRRCTQEMRPKGWQAADGIGGITP